MEYVVKAHASGQTAKTESLEAAKEAAAEMDLSSGATIIEVRMDALRSPEWYYSGPLDDKWVEQ